MNVDQNSSIPCVSQGGQVSGKQRRLQYRMSLQVERNIVPTSDIDSPLAKSTSGYTPTPTYDQLMDSLNPPVPPPRGTIARSPSVDRPSLPLVPSSLRVGPSMESVSPSTSSNLKEKEKEELPLSASEWSRQQDTKRYAQSLKYATSLLQRLEQISSAPLESPKSRKKSNTILDVTSRCIGLGIPTKTIPGTLQLTWKQGVSIQIQSNGNMALFYTIISEKKKPEKHVRHYYLTKNGLSNAATDLNCCLTGHIPICKFG